MNYAAMADDLGEFFAREHIDCAHLLGHSMGGKVAMQFTATTAKCVSKLTVVDISPKKYPPTHRSLLAALRGLQLANYKSYSEIEHAIEGQIPEAPVRQFLLKNLARRADQTFHWRIGLDEIDANYDQLTGAVVADGIVETPTCFIRGGRSNLIADVDLPAIRQIFPTAEIVTIANAGHWIHIDAAPEFYETVTGFLLRNGR